MAHDQKKLKFNTQPKKWEWPKNKGNLKIEETLKNEESLKNEEYLNNEDNLQNRCYLKNEKITSKGKTILQYKTTQRTTLKIKTTSNHRWPGYWLYRSKQMGALAQKFEWWKV